MIFHSLDSFKETRAILHYGSQLLGAAAKQHGTAHPRWWHVSLNVQPHGLVTDNIPLADTGVFNLRLDLNQHIIGIHSSRSESFDIDIRQHAASLRKEFLEVLNTLGCSIQADELPQPPDGMAYDSQKSEAFFQTLLQIDRIFKKHIANLPEPVSPVQLWPHGFDLAGEWFGGRLQNDGEQGRVERIPAQLNLGFYPGTGDDDSYFYSNPWPFQADQLLSHELPAGAQWHTNGWFGSILPYQELLTDQNAEEKLLDYARRVFEIAVPTLR